MPGPKIRITRADGKEDERVRIVELGRIGKKRGERVAVGCDVGREHVNHEAQRGYARKQPKRKQNAGDEFKGRDKRGGGPGRRQSEAREKLRHVRQIVKLSPAVLRISASPNTRESQAGTEIAGSKQLGRAAP